MPIISLVCFVLNSNQRRHSSEKGIAEAKYKVFSEVAELFANLGLAIETLSINTSETAARTYKQLLGG